MTRSVTEVMGRAAFDFYKKVFISWGFADHPVTADCLDDSNLMDKPHDKWMVDWEDLDKHVQDLFIAMAVAGLSGWMEYNNGS